jgi:hypothetical protein
MKKIQFLNKWLWRLSGHLIPDTFHPSYLQVLLNEVIMHSPVYIKMNTVPVVMYACKAAKQCTKIPLDI